MLFPHLRDAKFSGVVEVVNRDTANYLVLREGLIEQTYVVDDYGRWAHGAARARIRAAVAATDEHAWRGWPGPLGCQRRRRQPSSPPIAS